ncbi:MAG TPA: ATP-binding protein [Planctomycetota bacterium]|nr:ATP-binding protein [Planctomycetota bacterium]
MMIPRRLLPRLTALLRARPVVALVGPRQVGKTTLARRVADDVAKSSVHLDLERPGDRAKLGDAELFLGRQANRLTILDEVQRMPEVFPLLRSLVDERIRAGEKAGHFLVLGSASRDLLQQSSESLAGRISYLELSPFTLDETERPRRRGDVDRLWLRGGFPDSYLAHEDAESDEWRGQFVQTYLTRDLPQLGLRLPGDLVGRFWTMLAHGQGNQLNAARLAASLGVSGNTVRHYLDVLTDLFMVRQLRPWSGNSTKRLVKAPKVYVRDSGLTHHLARILDLDILLGHPLCGATWEGFVIENILAQLPDSWQASYYRTSAQAEIDLVLEGPRRQVYAVEIKRTLSPKLSKGYQLGFADVGATRGIVAMPAGTRFPLAPDVEAVPLKELIAELPELFG